MKKKKKMKNMKDLSGSDILRNRLHLSGVSLDLLLKLMCDAFEFAELPVRHNEEYLNEIGRESCRERVSSPV